MYIYIYINTGRIDLTLDTQLFAHVYNVYVLIVYMYVYVYIFLIYIYIHIFIITCIYVHGKLIIHSTYEQIL